MSEVPEMPDELKKLLKGMGIDPSSLMGGISSGARHTLDAMEAPEVQKGVAAFLTMSVYTMFQGPLTPAAKLACLALICDTVLLGEINSLTEHNATCGKHDEQIEAMRELRNELHASIVSFMSSHMPESNLQLKALPADDMPTTFSPPSMAKTEKAEKVAGFVPKFKVDAAVAEFDKLMKAAIAKGKAKKSAKAEHKALITLISGYTGELPVMLNVKNLLLSKPEGDKEKVIADFIKSVSK